MKRRTFLLSALIAPFFSRIAVPRDSVDVASGACSDQPPSTEGAGGDFIFTDLDVNVAPYRHKGFRSEEDRQLWIAMMEELDRRIWGQWTA